jgi:hypothetical protein
VDCSGDDLLPGAQRTNEEFASVMTEQTSGGLAGALLGGYPIYARHADRARQRTGAADKYTLAAPRQRGLPRLHAAGQVPGSLAARHRTVGEVKRLLWRPTLMGILPLLHLVISGGSAGLQLISTT